MTSSWDRTARIWHTMTGKQVMVLAGHEEWVEAASFSPDGTRIVIRVEGQDRAGLGTPRPEKQVAVLVGHEAAVNSATFSPDGARIVTASWDGTVRLWDAATGRQIALLRGNDVLWLCRLYPGWNADRGGFARPYGADLGTRRPVNRPPPCADTRRVSTPLR